MHIIVSDNLDQAGLDILEAAEGITYEAPGKMSRDELLAKAESANGLIIRSGTKADKAVLEAMPNLKAIARAGVGVDNVDLEVATQRGVVVMNAPDGNTIATAEQTLALMLALARHTPQAHQSLLAGQWDRKTYVGTELRGKTLGIIGLGRVGQAVAQRAKAFEMKVIAYDPFVKAEVAAQMNVLLYSLDDVLTQSDYITLHAVVTDETRGMLNAETIAKMKDGARVINVARGSLIDETALAAALQSGKLGGAALDVYATEPPANDHPLIGLAGVIHTPHLGASTAEAQINVAIQAAENLVAALTTGTYQNVVNPAVLGQ